MKYIIQKFGGTSVRDERSRLLAKDHILQARKQGYKVIAVVSAMGRFGEPYATDTLLSLVNSAETKLNKREQDLLLSTGETISSLVFTNMLLEHGMNATALTGAQAGFITSNDHTNAKIVEMNTDRLKKELETYDVVVVAGFQGANLDGDTTTLGRGGSDTSAAALGVAINADFIDIFTDVDGIMTADPRIAKKARKLEIVSYLEVCNMAYQGAKVIHPRAVEIAMQGKVPIRIRSTYSTDTGTLVTTENLQKKGTDVKERPVTGIAHLSNVSQIKVFAQDGEFDLHSNVFKAMANEEISVDFINISLNSVVYTVSDYVVEHAANILRAMGYDPQIEHHCAKVSVVGAGMTGVPGVTSKVVSSLSEKSIRILQSADSHTTIWVLIKEEDLNEAVNALHDIFELQHDVTEEVKIEE